MTITNDGNGYSIRDEEGVIVHVCAEYLDAVAFIRRQHPSMGEWAHGFAPADDAHTAQRGVAQQDMSLM